MQRQSEQFNNFLGGITSELRTNYEVPKFARLWNFDVSSSRAIQHYGLESVVSGKAHILDYEPNLVNNTSQWFLNRHTVLAVEETGDITLIDTSCGLSTSTFTLDKTVVMSTLPIVYQEHVVWLSETGPATPGLEYQVWMQSLNGGAAFQVLSGITATEGFQRNTFFQTAIDGRLYIFSGKRVHRVELPNSNGKFNSDSDLAPYQPIEQFMQSPNRNGNVGTYTGLNGPETQIIQQIDEAQKILFILGYYTSSIDGVFGPATYDAVFAFQGDYNHTGNVPGGAAIGTPLIQDGIIGPETQAVMNATDDYFKNPFKERKNVLVLPDVITAVCQNGGLLNIGTHDRNGDAIVFYWDKSLTAEGIGDIGLLTSAVVGKGVIQILKPLNGRLMALMTPATDSFCLHKYVKLSVYAVQASFDLLPSSFAVPLAEYNLRLGPDGSPFDDWRFNLLNQKSVVANSRLYFSGQINLQHIQEPTDGEGVFAGVMSIDSNGNLFTEVAESTDSDDLTFVPVNSFGLVDSGFVLATETDVLVTSESETDNISGLITNIINGGRPWEPKILENIYLSLAHWEDVDKVEIWIREVDDLNDSDGGWDLAYTGLNQDSNSIQINKMESNEAFWQFKELQVMVKIFGIGSELNNLTVNYNMLEINN